MFYEPSKGNHSLRFNPFKSIAVPRPIGWITTLDLEGRVNLAPYSQFQNLGADPPYVMFSASGSNDSPRNAQDTGEFVCNMATYDLREAVNITSARYEHGVEEHEKAELDLIPSQLVKAPRVAACPIHMECRYHCSMVLPGRRAGASNVVVVGEVIGIHVKDEFIGPDGKIDIVKIRPLSRVGYHDYTTIDQVFTMSPPPSEGGVLDRGLEGAPQTGAVKNLKLNID